MLTLEGSSHPFIQDGVCDVKKSGRKDVRFQLHRVWHRYVCVRTRTIISIWSLRISIVKIVRCRSRDLVRRDCLSWSSRRFGIVSRSSWRSGVLVLRRCDSRRSLIRRLRLRCRCRCIMRCQSRLQCQILIDVAGDSFRVALRCSRHHLRRCALTLAATCATDECQHDCNDQQQRDASADNAADQCSVV